MCYDPATIAPPPAPAPAPAPEEEADEEEEKEKEPEKKFDFDNCDGRRVRKEFRCMKRKERERFVSAFKQLADAGVISDFTQMFDTNVWEATGGAKWLPWARTYLRRFENVLREINDDITIPYWDFTAEANDIAMSPIWSISHGIGKSRRDQCVADDPWDSYEPSYPERHCVMRGFTAGKEDGGRAFKVDGRDAMIRMVEKAGSYEEFANAAEYAWHRVRMSIGGEMAKRVAPNDPLYYLLLASFDRYWSLYQGREDVDPKDFGGDHRGGEADVEEEMAAFGGRKIKSALKVSCVRYRDPCADAHEPSETPKELWEPYLEANELPKDRTRDIEPGVAELLYGTPDEIEATATPEE